MSSERHHPDLVSRAGHHPGNRRVRDRVVAQSQNIRRLSFFRPQEATRDEEAPVKASSFPASDD